VINSFTTRVGKGWKGKDWGGRSNEIERRGRELREGYLWEVVLVP